MNAEDIVVDLIALNGGKLVDRTRLHRLTYLLQRCGAKLGLQFSYHQYGPYCFELVSGVDGARADRQIRITERPGRHGVPYATFWLNNEARQPEHLGGLSAAEARARLTKMQRVTDIVLELAAAIVFLRDEWYYFGKGKGQVSAIDSAVKETRKRKPLKASDDRIEKALALITELGLRDAAAAA